MCAGSDVMKLRRSARHTRESYSVVTQATVSRYVIVILLLGNMTLLHTLPQVTQKYAAMRFRYFKYFINFFQDVIAKIIRLTFLAHPVLCSKLCANLAVSIVCLL